ncbi:hypothetical protein HYX58_05970 [Candidatus Dependentiae bacterium]|nr:hypothetical protein [Candidatus Dependentiae bacterium]
MIKLSRIIGRSSFFSASLTALFLALTLWSGLFPTNTALSIYRHFISSSQNYLESRTAQYGLALNLHSEYDQLALIATIIIAISGIILCIQTIRTPIIGWLKELIINGGAICWRMVLYISILCIVSWAAVAVYFGTQLSALSPAKPSTSYWQAFLTYVNPITLAKMGWRSINKLFKAQNLFDSMNYVSFAGYCISLAIDIISTLIFFLLLYKALSANKKATS